MARVTRVKKAAKDQRNCEKCGVALPAGSAYKWVKPRAHKSMRGIKRVRCTSCPDWRRSEISSSKLADAYAAQEMLEDTNTSGYTTMDEFEALADTLADMVEGCADGYEESADAIEDGFGHEVPMSEELREKADMVREWAEEIRYSAQNADVFEEAQAEAEVREEDPDVDEDDVVDLVEEKRDEWREAVLEAIQEAMYNEPF